MDGKRDSVRVRVKGLEYVEASRLKQNAYNHRLHGESQRRALRASAEEIGFVTPIIACKDADGNYVILDGHLRAQEFQGDVLPVIVVELSEEEARKFLASHDYVAAMGKIDTEKLLGNITELECEVAEFRKLLIDMECELLNGAEVGKRGQGSRKKGVVSDQDWVGAQGYEHFDCIVVVVETHGEYDTLLTRLGLRDTHSRHATLGRLKIVHARDVLKAIGGIFDNADSSRVTGL